MAAAPLVAVLQVGDTSTPTDSVDLNDQTNCVVFGFDEGTIAEPPGSNPEDTNYAYLGRRILKIDLIVMDTAGQSFLTAQQTIRKIEHKLTQAQRAIGAGGQWIGTPVTLRLRQLDGTAPYVYADVVGGTLTQLWATKGTNPVIHCTLALQCLPYFHGDLLSTSVLASSSAYQFTQVAQSVPGDRSALATLYFGDISGTGHTNRIRVGRRSFPNMGYDAFWGVVDTKPDGGTDTADATAANGHYCRITATPNAQKIATAGLPDKFNGWESGDFTSMTGHTASGTGALSEVIVGAALVGGFGFHAKAGSSAGGQGYAYYFIPYPTQATYMQSWINVRNSLTTGTGGYMRLQNSGTGVILSELQYTGSQWVMLVRRRDGVNVTVALSLQIAATTWTLVRLVYDQQPAAGQPLAQCYISTDGRIWTLAAQYQDATAGTVYAPSQATLIAINESGAIAPEAWFDQFQTGDWNPLRAQQHGKVNAWARARTNAGSLQTPTGLAGAITLGTGSLQAGTFGVYVTALDGSGNETAASTGVAFTLAATGEIVLTWTDVGTASNHRVYVNDVLSGSSRWTWVATGSASSTYTLAGSLPLANSGSPPVTSATALGTAYLRGDAAVATPFGTPNYVVGKPQPFLVGNGNWESVFLGTFDLPPMPRSDAGIAGTANVLPDLPWTLTVSGFYGGTGSPTIDVDAIYLLPHDEPQLSATYSALNLATQCYLDLDGRRDGRVSGVLRLSDFTPFGQLRIDGRFTLGIGNNLVQIIPEIASGVNLWSSFGMYVTFTYRPRYIHLPGAVS